MGIEWPGLAYNNASHVCYSERYPWGFQVHWPDRYVPLFGAGAYDIANEREDIPFEEQLRALDNVVKAGKVHLSFSIHTGRLHTQTC